tara:strand:+ start:3739 stop:4695 length:957 start_codon:yes stop_codon:yes gene_type:complete
MSARKSLFKSMRANAKMEEARHRLSNADWDKIYVEHVQNMHQFIFHDPNMLRKYQHKVDFMEYSLFVGCAPLKFVPQKCSFADGQAVDYRATGVLPGCLPSETSPYRRFVAVAPCGNHGWTLRNPDGGELCTEANDCNICIMFNTQTTINMTHLQMTLASDTKPYAVMQVFVQGPFPIPFLWDAFLQFQTPLACGDRAMTVAHALVLVFDKENRTVWICDARTIFKPIEQVISELVQQLQLADSWSIQTHEFCRAPQEKKPSKLDYEQCVLYSQAMAIKLIDLLSSKSRQLYETNQSFILSVLQLMEGYKTSYLSKER